jgi:peptidoglycan hydrolase CwlO-like protein
MQYLHTYFVSVFYEGNFAENLKTMENFISILGYIITPISAVIAWFAGRKKANNDFLQNMQSSIDLLTAENTKLVKQVIELNNEVVELRKENAKLRAEIEELNEKFSNVKTITRTK